MLKTFFMIVGIVTICTVIADILWLVAIYIKTRDIREGVKKNDKTRARTKSK